MLSIVSGLEHFEEVSNSCSRGLCGEELRAASNSVVASLLAPKTGFVEDNFSMDQGMEEWFQDDSSALCLLCTLFLLLLHCDI